MGWDRFGRQIAAGQGAFEEGRTRMGRALLDELTAANAVRKTDAELAEMERMKQFRDPKYGTRIAGALAGLTDPQTDELQGYLERGNWGPDMRFGPPAVEDMTTAPAPQWATPDTLKRVGQVRAAQMIGLAGKGDSNADHLAQAVGRFIDQGREDSAFPKGINSPEELSALAAARKGNLIDFNEAMIVNRGTGAMTLNPVYAKVKEAEVGLKGAQARAEDADAYKKRQEGKNAEAGPKAPAGYRYTADGSLEAIPGGPADQKAQADAAKRASGVEDVNAAVATLRDAYNKLEQGVGITSTEKGPLDNLRAASSSSALGQMVGRALGTENQSARNTIAMTRPALLASLMKATGMSAKQMDSNAELKLWMATATDPTLDVQANRDALAKIEQKYLMPGSQQQKPPSEIAAPPKMTPQERQQSVLKARAAIQAGKDKAEVVRRLEAAGITDHGIR